VLDKVLGSASQALALAGLSLVFFFGLWFGVTLTIRARIDPAGGSAQPMSAVSRPSAR
jgi:hypothetical protein